MEIRDPIHGFIELDEHEARLVDRPEFQRLRGIHQLGMAYLAYPGATHTRFEHSLGVCHVAGLLAGTAGLRDHDIRQVRLAALLHDIGHGPFSHVSEYAFAACNAELTKGDIEEFHERIGLSIVARLEGDHALKTSERESVENLLNPRLLDVAAGRLPEAEREGRPPLRSVAGDIVSGPLDADKLDYLLRDSRYSGVQYGVYDLQRLVRAVCALEEPPNSYLAVRHEDISAVDQFIIANHNMWIQVYNHKVRRIADLMVVRSVLKAIEHGNDYVCSLYRYENNDRFLERYLKADEAELIRRILEGPDGTGKELMRRLVNRHLLKEVFEEPLQNLSDEAVLERLIKTETERQSISELEHRIANACDVAPELVFVELRRSRPVRRRKPGPVDTSEIHVVGRGGRGASYDQVSQFFRYGQLKGDDFLSVWLPVDEADRQRRAAQKNRMLKRILSVIALKEGGDGQARS